MSQPPRAADDGPTRGQRPAERSAERSAGGADAVEALWQRFLPLVEERVRTMEEHLDGKRSKEDARRAAHALAGALGSYGRAEGSRVAAQLEELLGGGAERADHVGAREQVRRLVVQLRASL